jgi:hypothetical protein
MGRFISRKKYTSLGFLALVSFLTLTGFDGASAATSSGIILSQDHFPTALAVLMFLAMSAIEGWLFWTAWKNRETEEASKPKVFSQTPLPITLARTPAPRKRASKERAKVLV